MNRKLKNLARDLGKIRELDVAIRDAKSFGMNSRPLKKSRKNLSESAVRSTSPRKRQMVNAKIDKVVMRLRGERNLDVAGPLSDLSERMKTYARKRKFSARDLHQLRITLKKVRYTREATGKPAASLEKLQDVLGRAHDLEVLENLLGNNERLTGARKRQERKATQLTAQVLRSEF